MTKKSSTAGNKKADKSTSAKATADKEKKFPAALAKHLEAKKVNSKILDHKTVYTAMDVANTLKRKMAEIVKTLLIKADSSYYIICLPSNQNLDFDKVKKAIEKSTGKKIKAVKIPSEQVMKELLKLREEGMSAFGSFHNLPVIAEKKLTALSKAVFPSGSFNHSVEMKVKDFLKLENAVLASFGINKKVKLTKVRPNSPIKMKTGANKTMATKKKAKKAKKAVKKPVAKKKKATKKKK
jgi:prolyl-tRNA editing enzyme YbaK/EbsC (Cys-tRNA(Pro) deacylase)